MKNGVRLGVAGLVLGLIVFAVFLLGGTRGSAARTRSVERGLSEVQDSTVAALVPFVGASSTGRREVRPSQSPADVSEGNTRSPGNPSLEQQLTLARTEREYLAVYRAMARTTPQVFDDLLLQRLSDVNRPLAERVALARSAWLEDRPGWTAAYGSCLTAKGTNAEALGSVVQRWLGEDAPRRETVRSFTRDALWGDASLGLSSSSRRGLVRGLFTGAPLGELPLLETNLHAEADREVVRSALIAWGRRLPAGEAQELFARFGLEPPRDLHARNG